MEWGTFLLGALSILIAQIVVFSLDMLRQDRQARLERRRSIRERGDAACSELLDLLDQAERLFDGAWEHGSGPGQDELRDVVMAIDRKAVTIPNRAVRERLKLVSEALFQHHAIEGILGDRPRQIASMACHLGRQIVGSVLNDEPLPDTERLDSFHGAVLDNYGIED